MTDSRHDNPVGGSDTPSGDDEDGTSATTDRREIESTIPKESSTPHPPALRTDELDPDTKTVDGRYELLGLLGSGSMGNVYKVRDLELDETIALKTLHSRFARDEGANRRFRREVKLARRVTHPNVARTFDLGVAEGIPYMTMEFISGDSLQNLLRSEGALNSEQLLAVVEPICRGLQAAHDAGVVHRDLKPQNVMLEENGRVIVTDFGIARASASTGQISDSNNTGMVGTPAYMAPEQVADADEIDARADIYALGVMLYEMLTGALPWKGDSAISIAFERWDRPPPTLPEEGDWPQACRDLVHQCLARERDDRPSRALEVADGLQRALSQRFSTFDADFRPAPPTLPGEPRPDRGDRADRFTPVPKADRTFDGVSIAVLPFEFSGPERDEYLAVGLTEEIIDELSRTEGLAVLPRGTVDRYHGREIAPSKAGNELGVEVVVEGSILRLGETLRVRTAITSVEEGFQLWADRFETRPEDLLEVGTTAADAITRAMTIDPESDHYDTPRDPTVVDLYMRARHAMHEHWFSDLEPALKLYREALDRAPGDPRVLSGIAIAQARAAFVDAPNREAHLAEAEALARRAAEAAPDWPEPYLALARVHFNRVDLGRALDAVNRALDIAADFADAHALRGRILAEIGPLDSAARHLSRTLDLNPYDYNARWDLARAFALLGSWDRVDRLLEQPVDSELHTVLRYANRTRLDLWRSEPNWLDADTPEVPPDSDFEVLIPVMRHVTRGGALDDGARKRLDVPIADDSADSRYLSLQYQFRAEVAARAGDIEFGLRAVERAHDTGLVDLNWLDYAPVLEVLRDHERFQDVRRSVQRRVDSLLED